MTPYIFAGLPDWKRRSFRVKNKKDIESILHDICKSLRISEEIVISKLRTREYAEARMIISGVIMKTQKVTLKNVGEMLKRDHSSVVHYRNTFNNLLKVNDKSLIEKLKICGFENLIP